MSISRGRESLLDIINVDVKWVDQIPLLSVLMPAFNEGKHIETTIENLSDVLNTLGVSYEIVVVNDGSHDNTPEILHQIEKNNPQVKFVNIHDNHGKGHALKAGFEHVEGVLVQFMDADSDLNPLLIPRFIDEMKENGSDVVIGSKRHPESEVDYPLKRRFLSKGYSMLLRLLFGIDVTDTQVGMKLFKKQVLDEVMPLVLVKRYAFDIELLSLAYKKGYTISEAPIKLDFKGTSNINWRAIARIAWDTAAVFYRLKILKYYDKMEENEI